MKKYISAVLIPCLLLQLSGCYSMGVMTLEELKNYAGPNDIKIKTDQNEFLINRKSNETILMNWEAGDSLIVIKTTQAIKMETYNNINTAENYNSLKNQLIEIKYDDIESVEIEELDLLKTAILTVGIFVIVTFVITGASFDLDLSSMKF